MNQKENIPKELLCLLKNELIQVFIEVLQEDRYVTLLKKSIFINISLSMSCSWWWYFLWSFLGKSSYCCCVLKTWWRFWLSICWDVSSARDIVFQIFLESNFNGYRYGREKYWTCRYCPFSYPWNNKANTTYWKYYIFLVKKVLMDVLELGVWSGSACGHTIINKKARDKERWFIIRECNALLVSGKDKKISTGHSGWNN